VTNIQARQRPWTGRDIYRKPLTIPTVIDKAAPGGDAMAGAVALQIALHRPWSVEGHDACFIIRDHSGQALAVLLRREGQRRTKK
jgi:hypothetical protein